MFQSVDLINKAFAYCNSFITFQNEDGKLTMEEFREGSKCDPWIVQALAIDLPQEDLSQADE